MARYKCPSCGKPYNGKRCRECYYEPCTEEIAHGWHAHEGEPLVVKEIPIRTRSRSDGPAVSRKDCSDYPGKRKKKKSAASVLAAFVCALLMVCIRLPVWDAWDVPGRVQEAVEEVHADVELELPDIDADLAALTPPETAPDITLYQDGIVLYADDDVVVLADWQEGQAYDPNEELMIYVQNNSGQDLNVSAQQVSVNGYMMYYSYYYCEAAAGHTSAEMLWLDGSDLQTSGIETVETIGFYLNIYDAESYDTYADSEYVTLQFAVPEGFVQPVDDSGQPIYEKNGIKIAYRGSEGTVCEDAYLWFYMENTTDATMYIYASSAYANGEDVTPYLWAELRPGTRMVTSMWLYGLAEEAGIDTVQEIETLELVLEITNEDTWAVVDQTQPLPVDVHG